VVEVRTVELCPERGLYWYRDLEPPRCKDKDHDHPVVLGHRHLDTVVLPDDTMVTAASFDSLNPYGGHPQPDYGLYLDPHWQPPWEHDLLAWPDFGVPATRAPLRNLLGGVLDRSRSGKQVQVGCLGGHGRTGTALACLAVMSGLPAPEAVSWVRQNYCSDAVETPEQEEFVVSWPYP
jgi:Protein-tyrosine phosphatase